MKSNIYITPLPWDLRKAGGIASCQRTANCYTGEKEGIDTHLCRKLILEPPLLFPQMK